MDRIFIMPAAGLRVVDPASGEPLPPEGKEVERNVHWLRRLREGDVTERPTDTRAPARGKKE